MNGDGTPPERHESIGGSTAWSSHVWNGSDHVSTAVINAVAATTDCEPTALSPLYDHIDPDALEALMARPNGATKGIMVAFSYDGVDVRVDNSGCIAVQRRGADRE